MINRAILIMLKKELIEQARTYKLLIVAAVFLFFGLMSPLTAKYMPEIIAMIGAEQNISIQLPEPTVTDALSQYVKNISQICVFVLIFVVMGIVAQEKENSTAAFLLVKPLKRTTFVVAKYIGHVVLVCIGLGSAFVACSFYTALFFPDFAIGPFVAMNGIILLYIVVVTSITVCFSTMFKGQVGAGVTAFITWIALSLLSSIPGVGTFFPGTLIEESAAVAAGMTPMWQPFLGAGLLIGLSFSGALLYFRRWEAV